MILLRGAVRAHLSGIAGWGAFFSFFGLIEVTSFQRLNQGSVGVGFALQLLSDQMSYMVRPARRLDLLAGYLEWFLTGFYGIYLSIWAAVAGTGALRGDDEKGLLEQNFAVGVRPLQLAFARLAGFAIAISAVMAVAVAAVLGGAALTGQSVPARGLVIQSLSEAGPALTAFGVSLVIARLLPTRRNALGVAAIVLVGMYFVNGFSRSVELLRPFAEFTPFAHADRSYALLPGGAFAAGDLVLLLATAILLTAAAGWLLGTRDLGSAVIDLGRRNQARLVDAPRTRLLQVPALVAIWEQRVGISVWMIALFLYAQSFIPLARPFVDGMAKAGGSLGPDQMKVAFGLGGTEPVAGFIAKGWFGTSCIVLAVFAIVQVARWAGEDADGHLEMLLAAGVARWRVVVERALAVTAMGLLMAAANCAAVLVGARMAKIELSSGGVVLGALLTVPLMLAFAAAGAALAAWRPRLATFALGAVVLVGYFIPLMAVPIFARPDPPEWFLNLSVFRLYGTPLTTGVFWSGLAAQVAITLAGFGLAVVAIRRRDVNT